MDVDCHWPSPTSDLSLSGDEVHVWCACLNQPDTFVEQMVQTLSTDELKRAERFHFLQHRNQFIVAHGLLSKLLAIYLDIGSDRITFGYGKNGKPFLSKNFVGDKIRFNISQSNGYALFAFTCEREIGVDIEHICEFADMDKVAEQVFELVGKGKDSLTRGLKRAGQILIGNPCLRLKGLASRKNVWQSVLVF